MNETITFIQRVVLSFSDLVPDLENIIFNKLSDQDFFNTPFEVLNITFFEIKEMKVSGLAIVCTVKVTANCNNPVVGKIIKVENFEIKNRSIIISEGRIKIIARVPNNNIKSSYTLKIDKIKLMVKNILCVASVID